MLTNYFRQMIFLFIRVYISERISKPVINSYIARGSHFRLESKTLIQPFFTSEFIIL